MNFDCENTSHKQSEVILFCLNEFCQQSKLICDQCIQKDLHNGHYKDLVKFQDLNEFFLKRSQECDQFIKFMQMQIDSSQELLNQIKVGLRQKYQINEARIKQLNNQQLSQAIIEIVQFLNKKEQIEMKLNGGIMNLNSILKNIHQSIGLDNLTYKSLSEIEKQYAKALYDEGHKLYSNNKNYWQAIEKFDQSLNINPFDQNTLSGKGYCLFMLGKYNEAIIWWKQALEINPKFCSALYYTGLSLSVLGKDNEALACLDKALDINPNHAMSLYRKGECLRSLGQYDEALIWLDKALEIDQNYGSLLGSKANTLKQSKRYEDAVLWFDKALTQDPDEKSYIEGKKYCQEQLKMKK